MELFRSCRLKFRHFIIRWLSEVSDAGPRRKKRQGQLTKKNRAPNILKRNFTAERPMAKLTTDVTYIPWYNTGRIQKKLGYLSPVRFREAFLDKSPRVMEIIESRMSLGKSPE